MDWLIRYVDHPVLLLISVVIAVPVLHQYFKWFFGDASGLRNDIADAAVQTGLPSSWTLWQGEWAEVKIGTFLLLVVSFTAALYKIVIMIFF